MYICVCHAVNEQRVKEAISQGNRSVGALRRHFAFESCCGRCNACLRSLIDQHPGAGQTIHEGANSCKATIK